MVRIALAATEAELRRCFPVMVQLRPHLTEATFIARVQQQQQQEGFHLAYLESDGVVKSLAGYRFGHFLAWGRVLYVDDLVTDESARGDGFGQQLIEWLVAQAKAKGCDEFHLDSGVQRHGAHRFYLSRRMDITCHHFAMKLR